MMEAKHAKEWKVYRYEVGMARRFYIEKVDDTPIAAMEPSYNNNDDEVNANLIVAACNNAMKVNPSNPIAAAEALPDLFESCNYLVSLMAFAIARGQSTYTLELNGVAAERICGAVSKTIGKDTIAG